MPAPTATRRRASRVSLSIAASPGNAPCVSKSSPCAAARCATSANNSATATRQPMNGTLSGCSVYFVPLEQHLHEELQLAVALGAERSEFQAGELLALLLRALH